MENLETTSLDGECTDLDNQPKNSQKLRRIPTLMLAGVKGPAYRLHISRLEMKYIEAFEMMIRMSSDYKSLPGGRYFKRKGKLWLIDALILSRLSSWEALSMV